MSFRQKMLLMSFIYISFFLLALFLCQLFFFSSPDKNNYVWLIVFLLIFALLIFSLSYYLGEIFTQRILKAENIINDIVNGHLPDIVGLERNDEEGRILQGLNKIIQNFIHLKDFFREVGNGNFDTHLNLFNNQGDIALSISHMSDNLKKAAFSEKERTWASEGFNMFIDIIRLNISITVTFYDNLLSALVKYIKANQGCFYITRHQGAETYIELVACYAYEKKKYFEKRIEVKEGGLVGQCYQEGRSILITNVPPNFIHITSGLGEASPRCLLIVPLKLNEQVFGLIELASFEIFKPYEIAFVEKLGESIASSLSAAEIAEKTRHLLEASQQQAEELRSAEEEVRLNMEEMATINEHLYRKEVEVQKILEEMKANEEDLQQLEFKFRQTTIQLQQTKKELKNKDNKITELVANEKSFQDELEKIKSRNCN